MTYTCLECGYVFDEDKGVTAELTPPNYNALLKSGCGWHKGGQEAPREIPAGTKWCDVPQDFFCPSCYAGKDSFE